MYDRPNAKNLSVATIFGNAYKAVRPFRIRWENKEYTIKAVGYRHHYREGARIIHVFSATDGLNFFELLFEAADVRWMLGQLKNNHGH